MERENKFKSKDVLLLSFVFPPLPFTLKMVQSIHSFTSTCTGRVKIFFVLPSFLSIDEKRREREAKKSFSCISFHFISSRFSQVKKGVKQKGERKKKGKKKSKVPGKQASSVIKTS